MEEKATLTDMMVAYAQDAVGHAQASSGVALDYSLDSIRGVEEIMDQLHAGIPRGFWGKLLRKVLRKGPSPEDLYKVSMMYGGYVGEVFRKAGGGEWTLDAEIVPGQDTICLRNGGQRIWPTAKVYKRILNGGEDSIWFYSQVVMGEWK
jgi:hypothetical protein